MTDRLTLSLKTRLRVSEKLMSEKKLKDLVVKMSDRGKKRSDIDPETLKIFEDMMLEDDAASLEKPASTMPRSAEKRSEQDQLPLWPKATRGVPNAVLRSALFGVVMKGRRRFCNELEVPSAGNLKIKFTGLRLDQADLDVWEQCLSLAKENGLGTRIEFIANHFLEAIGRSKGKSQHKWLKESLKRLNGAQVEIQEGDRAYFGTLIYEGFRDEGSGHYIVQLNPKLSRLYGQHNWTRVQWDQRHALKRDLSQWLHGFYSSHKAPFPIKTKTIHWLCGSENLDMSGFRKNLKNALIELQTVTGWRCWIDRSDRVNIVRKATA